MCRSGWNGVVWSHALVVRLSGNGWGCGVDEGLWLSRDDKGVVERKGHAHSLEYC